MSDKILLVYWDLRGRGERCRLLLEYLKLPYEQFLYTSETQLDWFQKNKQELMKINPAINLPYIKDGDKYITESDAIMIYLIHKSGRKQLLGRNVEEQVRLATTMGVYRDSLQLFTNLIYGFDPTEPPYEEARPKFLQKIKIPLQKLSGCLGQDQYFCGKITWVDFILADFIQTLRLFESSLFDSFQNLVSHQQRIWALPEISNYIESGRFKQRPVFYPSYAKWY